MYCGSRAAAAPRSARAKAAHPGPGATAAAPRPARRLSRLARERLRRRSRAAAARELDVRAQPPSVHARGGGDDALGLGGEQRVLELAELDAEAGDLDLRVLAAEDLDQPASRTLSAEVARAEERRVLGVLVVVGVAVSPPISAAARGGAPTNCARVRSSSRQ